MAWTEPTLFVAEMTATVEATRRRKERVIIVVMVNGCRLFRVTTSSYLLVDCNCLFCRSRCRRRRRRRLLDIYCFLVVGMSFGLGM
jgi:hypothetical protein